MAVEKQHFDDDQPIDEERITIELPPGLRKQIRAAARKKGLPLDEYLRLVLEEAVLDEEREEWRPITLEAIERLRRLREEIMERRGGKLFGDSAEEIRQMREERDQYLEHRS